ncbi:MAG TPA: hypothetical protein VF142_17780, partial [Longimicrobium sp.]
VVSTPVSGTEEALRQGSDLAAPGLLVDPGPDAIAEGLRTVLGDGLLRHAMSAAAAHRAAQAFSWPAVLDGWERVLSGR